MRVHRVDVQAGIVLVAHAAVKSSVLELVALKKGLDRTFEFTALFHAAPLLLEGLVIKQLDRWGAVNACLLGVDSRGPRWWCLAFETSRRLIGAAGLCSL